MKRAVHLYKGMNTDISRDNIRNGLYIDALDIRITTDVGDSQGCITNIKGNKWYFRLPVTDNAPEITVNGFPEIIGATSIRETIVFFVADDSGTNGWIYKLDYSTIDQTIDANNPIVVYKHHELNFSKDHPIEAAGRFESGTTRRVYWTDYENYFRAINIDDSNLVYGSNNYPVPGTIDIFPSVEFTLPRLTNITTGGALITGAYQYSYRLSTTDGKETLISPTGNLIHIVTDMEANYDTRDYNGSWANQVSSKATEITIDITNYKGIYDKIELICAINATSTSADGAEAALTSTPQIFSIKKLGIVEDPTITEVVFIHTGTENTITELTLDEYTAKVYPFKTPKTITEKDGSLIAANIKGAAYSVQELLGPGETFDARTARYNAAGTPVTPFVTNTGVPETDELNKDKNAFNVDNGSGGSGYNLDAHWDQDWHGTSAQYKFKSDGETLGGQGPNISYTFHLQKFLIDNELSPNFAKLKHDNNDPVNLNDGHGNYANTTWDNMASPFRSGVLRGYKRGETYRFGIVFYDKKGAVSFVEYIGDIKFPDISEEDKAGTTNQSETNYFPLSKEISNGGFAAAVDQADEFTGVTGDNAGFANPDYADGYINTYAYALGIEFNISLPPILLSKIESYQIVRVKRTPLDSRRLCTGIMKPAMKIGVTTPNPNHQYDLSGPNGSDEIVHLFPYHHRRDDENALTGNAYGRSGTFITLNNQNIAGAPWPVAGGFIHFASADISYETPGIIQNINQGSCLLMTGRYSGFYSSIYTMSDNAISASILANASNFTQNSFTDMDSNLKKSYDLIDWTNTDNSENLGNNVQDHRWKIRTVGRVNKDAAADAVEYVKQLISTRHIQYTKNKQDDATLGENLNKGVDGVFTGKTDAGANANYHFRNFYAMVPESVECNLNDHFGSTGASSGDPVMCAWFQGASGLLASMDRIADDPLTGSSISSGAGNYPYFRTGTLSSPGNVKPKISSATSERPMTNTIATEMSTSIPILDIMQPLSQVYGGYNKTALENNVFQPASPIIDKAYLTPKVFGGDIFLNMFTFQEGTTYHATHFYNEASESNGFNQEFTENRSHTLTFVTESRVNIDLAWGATTKTTVEYSVGGGNSGFQKQVYRQETDNAYTDFGKSKKMYIDTYEFSFSSEQDDLAFFVKPDTFDSSSNVNDIRAYISQVKINDEPIDSWTKFGLNDYRDVDDYGPINRILNWRDTVFFYQDTAVGRYSINPRAITSTEDGVPTELGSAKGFQDHTYITKNYGAIHQWGVKATDYGIYSFDSTHKKIFRIGEGNQPLSEIKGIHGLLRNLKGNCLLRKEEEGDNPIKRKGMHIAKDKINNEVIFTFLGTLDASPLEGNTLYSQGQYVLHNGVYYQVTTTYTSFTPNNPPTNADIAALLAELQKFSVSAIAPDKTLSIVYDEVANEFSTRFSAAPSIYLENGNILLSPDHNSDTSLGQDVYQHNTGNWGEFYGNKEEMSITLVLNENADFNKVLRTIEFNSIVRDDEKNIDRTKTITAFQIKTEYQDTEKIQYSSGRVKRRFDKWRLKVPRDDRTINRLRSTYFELTLFFDNTDNREIILDRILYYYDVQIF